jgi:zinc protease
MFKVAFIALFGVAVFYAYKSWHVYQDKSIFEIKNFDLTQTKLDVAPLGTSFKEPVWSVKSESPMVFFSVVFKNEGDRSFKDSPEILNVLIATLLEGAGDRDGSAIKKLMADQSISISIPRDPDNIVVNVSCLSKYIDTAVDILCDVLSKAHLKREKIDIAKQGSIVSLKQSMFIPMNLAAEKLSNLMYNEEHPYRESIKKALEKIPNYSRDDLLKCYSSIFVPDDAEITIVSDLADEVIIDAINKIYKSIKAKKNNFKAAEKQETELAFAGKEEHVELDNSQSTVLFALPGVQRISKKRFAVRTANAVFGQLVITSRLAKNIRAGGLVYRVKTYAIDQDLHSGIVGECSTRPENVKDLTKRIRKECKDLYDNGITQEELDNVKNWKCGKNVLDTNEATLEFVESLRLDGVQLNEVNTYLSNYYNLTLEEVNEAIRDVFIPDKMILVDCGKSLKKEGAR